MTTRPLATVLAAALLWSASCIAHTPRRTFDPGDRSSSLPRGCSTLGVPDTTSCGVTVGDGLGICTSIDRLSEATEAALKHRRDVGCFSLEHHPHADNTPGAQGFAVHIIEFDDEGQLWNPDLVEATLRHLRYSLMTEQSVLISFVHGWKNDAGVCNNNLACFRSMLELAAKAEVVRAEAFGVSPRRVIGLYIGWRGGTITLPGVKQFTFWGRKHTAHTVGDNGGVTALIRRVRAIVDESRARHQEKKGPETTPTPTSLWIGHSFGAALLYSALATSINADAGEAMQLALRPMGGDPPNSRLCQTAPIRRRSRSPAEAASPTFVSAGLPVYLPTRGDLVMLINPAFEASRFANIDKTREVVFHPCQIPTLVTVASEGDTAVGGFFPVGQAFSTIFRAARSRPIWLSMAQGIGMYKPYHTHRLDLRSQPADGTSHPVDKDSSRTCTCPNDFRSNGDALVARLRQFYRHLAADSATLGALGGSQEYLLSHLSPVTDVDPNNPFMTIQVDRRIVRDHGDVFNSQFLSFVIEFTARIDHKRFVTREITRQDK
jgi:hypothetical protein